MASDLQVPLPALERLSTYIRCLMQLEHEGVRSISSQDMERVSGVSAAQFRKDLSYFGEFGKRGIGYNVHELRERIAHLLNVDEEQDVLLVGAGNLGSALIAYPGWRSYRFRIRAVFDRDPSKVGTSIRRLTVRGIDELADVNQEIGARIGLLAVPAWEAQDVARRLIDAGVTGLINFAPVRLQVPEQVVVREVCFICELAVLSHLIHHHDAETAGEPNDEFAAPSLRPVAIEKEGVVEELAGQENGQRGRDDAADRLPVLQERHRELGGEPRQPPDQHETESQQQPALGSSATPL